MSQIPMSPLDHLVNPEAIKLASAALAMRAGGRAGLQKAAFIPGGDPSMTGGGGGGAPPPGGDPSGGGGDPSGGGAPPPGMDPSMMMGGGGGDPSAGMGAPPPPPSGGGGGGGDMGAVTAKLDQLIQLQQGGMGQTGQNAAGQIKPKIDVNVAIMQISKMLARIADALGVKIPASEMIATPTDLTGMAQKQMNAGQEDASMAPGGAGGAGGPPGGIPPMQGMPDMSAGPGAKAGSDRHERGTAYQHAGLETTANKATALLRLYGFNKKAS